MHRLKPLLPRSDTINGSPLNLSDTLKALDEIPQVEDLIKMGALKIERIGYKYYLNFIGNLTPSEQLRTGKINA